VRVVLSATTQRRPDYAEKFSSVFFHPSISIFTFFSIPMQTSSQLGREWSDLKLPKIWWQPFWLLPLVLIHVMLLGLP
jgi:hypothetical protein